MSHEETFIISASSSPDPLFFFFREGKCWSTGYDGLFMEEILQQHNSKKDFDFQVIQGQWPWPNFIHGWSTYPPPNVPPPEIRAY